MKLELFLNKFLDELEKKNINYCILRNYKSLPKKLKSHDIDILINRNDLGYIIKIIQKYCNIVLFHQRDYLAAVTLHEITNSKKNYLKIDFVTKLCWKGLSFLDNETIFKDKIKFKSRFFVPQKYHETIITFFSSYLVGGWVNKKYQSDIRNEFIKNKTNIFKTLELKLSKSISSLIYKNVVRNNTKTLIKILGRLRTELVFFYIKKDLFNIFPKIFKYYVQEIKMRFSNYAITRIHFEYKDQLFNHKFTELINKDVKDLFKFSLNCKKQPSIRAYFSSFYNPYRTTLLLIEEISILDKQKKNKLLIKINKPDFVLRIKSKDYSNFKKYKNRIIKFLKLQAKQRIDNEIF